MLSKLGINPSFKGKIQFNEDCKDKEAISKALTPELKQRIEKELPDDCTLQFNEFGGSLLETSKYTQCVARRKESLTINEYVKKSVDNAIKLYKDFQDPEYIKKIKEEYKQRMKALDEYIKSLGDDSKKNK